MSQILYETYIEILTEIMDTLYSEGPVVIKLCSVIEDTSGNYSLNYGNTAYYPTDKVLGVTTSTAYSLAVDGLVTFLNIPDFNGIDVGLGRVFEVWNASETICFFRLMSDTPREIVGNNDIIRIVLEMPYGQEFNSVYQQINNIVVVTPTVPNVFPMQFKITFPDYLLRTDYHKIADFKFGLRNAANTQNQGYQVYASGDGGAVQGYRNGWKEAFSTSPSSSTSNDDYLIADFAFSDTLNAILTVDCIRSDIVYTQMYFDIYSKFYSAFDDYPPSPLEGSIPSSIFSPRDLIVERKFAGETSFTPIPVVTTNSNVGIDVQGIALQNPTRRYFSISATWTWEIFS